MTGMETDKHLFQKPMYQAEDGSWHDGFFDALQHSSENLNWDLAAVSSILSHHFPWGDRTLIAQIKRKPWLSSFQPDGKIKLAEIPCHDTQFKSQNQIADDLLELLTREVVRVCKGRSRVYLLLSGGLDSRIMAAVVSKAANEGKITGEIIAVTWGIPGSRDVVYAETVADILGIPWIHALLSPQDIVENIELSLSFLGCSVPAVHLHNMKWFGTLPKKALVLAASYGDGIGRAEFAGKHLLESRFFQPLNKYGLIKPGVFNLAKKSLKSDLEKLHMRTPGAPVYVLVEHERQGFYMRNMIAHVMSIINNYCQVYQVFTDPGVYSYMWSIHPSLRRNVVYAKMLKKLNNKLLRVPWARTNKALRGKTERAGQNLIPGFHRYGEWIKGPLYEDLLHQLDIQWLSETGIFQIENIKYLCQAIKQENVYDQFTIYNNFTWLIGFCRFSKLLKQYGKRVNIEEIAPSTGNGSRKRHIPVSYRGKYRSWYSKHKGLVNFVKYIRGKKKYFLFFQALVKFPLRRGNRPRKKRKIKKNFNWPRPYRGNEGM